MLAAMSRVLLFVAKTVLVVIISFLVSAIIKTVTKLFRKNKPELVVIEGESA